ncbi:MAG: peptidoglycan-binding protein [Actinomycetota bacterium]
MQGRRRLFFAVIAVAVLFGAGGFFLGQQLESPEEARAVVAAPEPSLIGVPVESVALSNDVVVRGDAQFEGAVDLVLESTLGDGQSRVVTGRVPEVDSLVDEGAVVIEVSGRPVFAFEGDLPAFREFKPGLEGDDVLQLEEALARLGFLTVTPDRLYGSATEDAIAAMYEAAGYEPRAASEGEEAQLDAARDQVDAANAQLANANDDLDDLLRPPTNVERLNDAQQREQLLEGIEDARQGVEDARERLVEEQEQTPSESAISALDALTEAERLGDVERIDDLNRQLAQAQRADAERLDAAREAITAAEERVLDAQEALEDFEARQAAEAADGTDTSRAEGAITDAEDRLAEAQADLAELEDEIGVRLPSAEIVFLPDLPRTVTSVEVERGDFVNGAVMRISGTEIRITTGVSEANRPLLEVGQRVIIDSAQLGIEVDGEIVELADRTGTNGVADTRYYMLVVPTGEYNVSEMVGVNFRLQIPLEKSDGEVLAVPVAGLFIGADSTSRVRVLEEDGSTRIVEVEVGLQDKNRSLVEVTPLDGSLEPGEFIVVGQDLLVLEGAESGGGSGDDDGGAGDGTESDGGS